MRPMLKYRGGKSREIPNIERHIPAFKGRYIEPFFGGGALFFHLEPEHAIINDINGKLMDFYPIPFRTSILSPDMILLSLLKNSFLEYKII